MISKGFRDSGPAGAYVSGSARRRSAASTTTHMGLTGDALSRVAGTHPLQDDEVGQKPRLVKTLWLIAVTGGIFTIYLVLLQRGDVPTGGPGTFLMNRRSGKLLNNGVSIAPETWNAAVGECACPGQGGYVYGAAAAGGDEAEPANVLRFFHHRRAYERTAVERNAHDPYASKVESDCGDHPTLEETVFKVWEAKRAGKVLWFDVKTLESRREAGTETGWECVFVSNPGRSKPFPPAEPAEAPWDESGFNFFKADPLEFMFEYVPSFRYNSDSRLAQGRQQRVPNGLGQELEAKFPAKEPREQAARGDIGLRGVLGEKAVMGGSSQARLLSVACGNVSDSSPPRHAVIVNVRPVGPVSVLLIPGYAQSLHQRATPEALAVAMDFSEAFMTTRNFRLGFNSGGSSASVNHLHFQCWFFDAGPRGMPLEVAETVFAGRLPLAVGSGAEEDLMEVHTLEGYPIRALVFHTLGKDLEAVGEAITTWIDQLLEDNTPHTMLFSHGRAFLLPRQPLFEPPFAAVPGFPEVSGEIIITSEEDFPQVTADQVFDFWRNKLSVSEERFNEIVTGCLRS